MKSTSPLNEGADRDLEHLAMNIVFQIGDLFSDFGDRKTRDTIVELRQASNDKAIDFVKKLVGSYTATTERAARIDELNKWFGTTLKDVKKGVPAIAQTTLLESIRNRLAELSGKGDY